MNEVPAVNDQDGATTDATVTFDDPTAVANTIASMAAPVLVVFDCDGVLAPLVDHADDSTLHPGVLDRLEMLSAPTTAEGSDTLDLTVAVVSGRSLSGLEQFDFPNTVIVVGSYGGERRDRTAAPLSDDEANRLAHLDAAAERALATAGDGAWIERKPSSVVLHIRMADPDRGARGLRELAAAQSSIAGSSSHQGSNVLEVMARPTDKGRALTTLRRDESAASVVYIGDDVPDEDAFASLGPGDLSIKVGPAPTIAQRRLADPSAVLELLTALTDLRR